jgi:hypothetical protein
MTVNEYFDCWFETVAENRYGYKTLEGYKGIIALDVRAIGNVKLSDLQLSDIQRIFHAMTARGVTSNTQHRLFSVISTAFDSAVAGGMVGK